MTATALSTEWADALLDLLQKEAEPAEGDDDLPGMVARMTGLSPGQKAFLHNRLRERTEAQMARAAAKKAIAEASKTEDSDKARQAFLALQEISKK